METAVVGLVVTLSVVGYLVGVVITAAITARFSDDEALAPAVAVGWPVMVPLVLITWLAQAVANRSDY